MSDYLSNLTAKSLDQVAVLQPRLASRFEPLAIAHQDFSELPGQAMPELEQQPAIALQFPKGVIADPFPHAELSNPSERGNGDCSFVPPFVRHDATNAVLEAILENPQQSGILSQQTQVERSELEADSAAIPPAGHSAASEPKPAAVRNPKTRALEPKTQAERQIAEDIQESSLGEVTNGATLDLFPSSQQKLVGSMEQTSPSVSDQPVPSPIFVEAATAKSVAQNSARMNQPISDRSPEIAIGTEDTTNTLPRTVALPAPQEAEQAWRGRLSHPVVASPSVASSAVHSFDSFAVSRRSNRDLVPAPIQMHQTGHPAIAIEPAQPSEFTAAEPPPTPTIQVTIGRIEVRATPPPSTPSKPRSAPAVMGLDDYLRQRAKGANR